jgi:hypothetical protein
LVISIVIPIERRGEEHRRGEDNTRPRSTEALGRKLWRGQVHYQEERRCTGRGATMELSILPSGDKGSYGGSRDKGRGTEDDTRSPRSTLGHEDESHNKVKSLTKRRGATLNGLARTETDTNVLGRKSDVHLGCRIGWHTEESP